MDIRTSCSPTDRESLHARVCRCVDEFLDACGKCKADLHGVETEHRRAMAQIGKVLNEAGVNDAMAEPLAWHCPECGQFLGYHDTQEKEVILASGQVQLKEGRYRCSQCGKDYRPVSILNDLEHTGYSLGAREKVVATATERAFVPTSEAVRPPVVVSAKKVEKLVAEAAGWLRQEHKDGVACYLGDRERPGPLKTGRPGWLVTQWKDRPLPEGAVPTISVDGGKVRGKEKDAEGKLKWFEGRAATFSITVGGEELPAAESGGKIYLAGKLNADEVFELMAATHAALPARVRALPTSLVADDGPWWDRTREYFPNAVQTLDLYHAGDVLSRTAGLCFREETGKPKLWRQHAREWLQEEGKQEAMIAELRGALPEAAGRLNEKEHHEAELGIAYLERNAPRMRYWEFKKKGLPIGSGVGESGVKQTMIARCRQAGMMWREDHADDIMRLRGTALSHELPSLFRRRREACLARARELNEKLELAA